MYKVVFNIEISGESPVLADIDPIATAYDVTIETEDKPDDDDFKIVTATCESKGDLSDFLIELFGEDSGETQFDEAEGLEIKFIIDDTEE
jgi:hypothetical protein